MRLEPEEIRRRVTEALDAVACLLAADTEMASPILRAAAAE
mgnify:CR=1 FL=1